VCVSDPRQLKREAIGLWRGCEDNPLAWQQWRMSHGAVMCVSVIGSPRCTSKSSRGCGGNGQYNTSVLLDCRGRRETVGVAALPGSAVMRTIPSIKTLLAHPWGLGSLRGRSTARRQRARGASVQRGSSFELTSFLYAARASCELPCRTARSISKRVVRRSDDGMRYA
jgi:hypothetical protein